MQDVFEVIKKLPGKFQPEAAAGLAVVFQFVIDSSHHFSLEIADQQCRTDACQHPDPDITLFMDTETFSAIIDGDLGGTSAYLSGRLRAEGNVMLATKLGSLFKR